ncbi:hypothetical protein [Pseudonocardia sp. Ae505_Ps2]|uniref:hypothetical protein n=1 Tax=Pseudonocardia sp. Ae505_Ps2 TaxID=1885034 RepID=UPI002016552F|nr:hypothetical protein [Pseudonocardia sp. Ae505_Ps2]
MSTTTALARSAASIERTPGASTVGLGEGPSGDMPGEGTPGRPADREVRADAWSYVAVTSAAASRACSDVTATTRPMIWPRKRTSRSCSGT